MPLPTDPSVYIFTKLWYWVLSIYSVSLRRASGWSALVIFWDNTLWNYKFSNSSCLCFPNILTPCFLLKAFFIPLFSKKLFIVLVLCIYKSIRMCQNKKFCCYKSKWATHNDHIKLKHMIKQKFIIKWASKCDNLLSTFYCHLFINTFLLSLGSPITPPPRFLQLPQEGDNVFFRKIWFRRFHQACVLKHWCILYMFCIKAI